MKLEDSKLDEEFMYYRVGKCFFFLRDCFCFCFFSFFICEYEFLNLILGKSFIFYRIDRLVSEDGLVLVNFLFFIGLWKESFKGESFGILGIFING